MWIIPKTLSAFVPATPGLKLELDEQAWMLEQSATVSGKLMSKQYWLRLLKKGGWMKRLSGLICPPSQHQSFVEKYRDSLLGIHVNHSVHREKGKGKKIQDTSGLKLENTPGQLEFNGFLQKMSKDISRLDSPQSSATWKKMVTKWRQEYSQRKKLALHTEGAEIFILGNSTSKRSCRGSKDIPSFQPEVSGQGSQDVAKSKSGQPRQSQARNGWQDISGGSQETRWPARPGEEQYEWESPRTVVTRLGGKPYGSPFRNKRLALLGNGVVPQTAELAWKTLWKEINKYE